MKSFPVLIVLVLVLIWFCMAGSAAGAPPSSGASNEVWTVLERFVKEKHALTESLAKKHKIEEPAQVEQFFTAAQNRDWNTTSNLFYAMLKGTARGRNQPETKRWMPLELWEPVLDVFGPVELFYGIDPKFFKMLGTDMLKDIPAGCIYFGGTDTGRFVPSSFSEAHTEGLPFFTITQNALADPAYLAYMREIYGDKITVPTTNDAETCVSNYTADAQSRLQHDQKFPNQPRQLRPGEDVHLGADGKLDFNNQLSVMAINAMIARVFFDKNPTKEFFVEESFPLDWMFPQLTPAGLIMKLNREPVPELTEDMLKRDHEFWSKYSERLVGDWITYGTPVKDVADFAEKVYLRHEFAGFKGDVEFVHDDEAQKAFSKMRSSIAGIYSWRLGMPPTGGTMPPGYIARGANRKLIEREADFAFKQAFAFCPHSPEVIYRYVQLLVNLRRVDDALLIAETGQKTDPDNAQFGYLVQNLKSIKRQSSSQSTAEVQDEIAQLEKAVQADPTDFRKQFDLVQKYLQIGKNERAVQVLDAVLATPGVPVAAVMSVADAYNRLNQPRKLETALETLTQLTPESPESWYDLAAVRASLGNDATALEALKKSLDLNAKRLAQNPKTNDVRANLATDERFIKLRDTAEFKALIAPQ